MTAPSRARPGPLRPPIPWERVGAPARAEPASEAPSDLDGPSGAPQSGGRRHGLSGASVAGTVLIGASLILYTFDPLNVPRGSSVVGIPVVLVLTPLILVLVERVRRTPRSFDLPGILLLSWGLHLVAAYFRFDNPVDASEYHETGKTLAESFRRFDFFVDTGREVPGTGSMRYLTGLVHVVTLSNFFTTFLIFVSLSFVGKYWFYRAFEIAFPSGDRKRYALLVFLWPTFVFWPSSLGKEACMITALALASLGTAKLLQRQKGGLICFVVGTVSATMIRPHVALILVIALLAAAMLRRTDGDPVVRLVAKAVMIVVVVVGGAVLSSFTADFLDLENLGVSEVGDALNSTVAMTNQGGSSFNAIQATNPVVYPLSFVTVVFRPFPGEAGTNLDGLLASAAGLFLLALTVLSARRILNGLKLLRSEPYLAYAFTSVIVFVFVFSVIGNFGILDRQRTQVLPFYFVLLAAPKVLAKARRGAGGRRAGPAAEVARHEPGLPPVRMLGPAR
jgi:hypothetical protein